MRAETIITMRILYFIKIANKWFYWDPYFKGDVYELEMVDGADVLLDKMAEGETNIVAVAVETDILTFPHYLELINEDELGGTYKIVGPYYSGELWLCNIAKSMFGKFPNKIGFQKVDKRVLA